MRKNTTADIAAKIRTDPATGCGIWEGSVDKDGYPLIKWQGKTTRVTRLVWLLSRGAIPDGRLVCHRCDNPQCVNIAHLFLGTAAENWADCVAKGRDARGAKCTPIRMHARRDPDGRFQSGRVETC